jgi:RimJ/RimL family protein N-acetyltransferase
MRTPPKPLNHTGTVPLQTARLTLRRLTLSDAVAVHASLATDPAVIDGVGWEPSPTPESTRAHIAAQVEAYARTSLPAYNWLVEETATGSLVGMVFVDDYREDRRVAEVDYCVARGHRGRGFAPEALRAVIRHLFERVGFHRVEAVYNMDNKASARVLMKAGMRFEGVLRGRALRIGADGFPEDLNLCAILATDAPTP